MSFALPRTVRKFPAGAISDYVQNDATPVEYPGIELTIQPDKGAFLRIKAPGSTDSDYIKIYDEEGADLYIMTAGSNRKSDEVLYNSKWYRIIEKQPYDAAQPIPHVKYIAVRLQSAKGN